MTDEDEEEGELLAARRPDGAPGAPQAGRAPPALQRRDSERFQDVEQYMTPKMLTTSAAQARCDACASAYGSSAARPLDGESLRNTKIRLIRPYQKQSKTFGEIDLRSVADAQLFEKIETTIYDEARQNANNPTMIPVGMLRKIKGKSEAGHNMNTFVGRPITRGCPLHAHGPGGDGHPYSAAPPPRSGNELRLCQPLAIPAATCGWWAVPTMTWCGRWGAGARWASSAMA